MGLLGPRDLPDSRSALPRRGAREEHSSPCPQKASCRGMRWTQAAVGAPHCAKETGIQTCPVLMILKEVLFLVFCGSQRGLLACSKPWNWGPQSPDLPSLPGPGAPFSHLPSCSAPASSIYHHCPSSPSSLNFRALASPGGWVCPEICVPCS